MAEEKVVNLRVDDNIPATVNNLKQLKKELKATAAGSAEFNKISQQIRDMDDAIKDASASSDDFAGFLENASGPVGMLGGAIRGAEKTFSSFNGALKASVIGLIVALVAGLVQAFQDNEQATKKLQPVMQKMEQIFQGVFKVVEPLFDILINLAVEALPIVAKSFSVVYSAVTAVFQSIGSLGSAVKKFIGGDFTGAFEDAKKSVTGFSKNYDDANKRFESGSKELTKSQKEELKKRKEDEKKHQDELKADRYEDAKNALADELNTTKLSYEAKRNLVNQNSSLNAKDKKALIRQINNDEIKSIDEHNKAIADLETKYASDAETRIAITEQQKLDLAKKRELDEINKITTNQAEKAKLTDLINAKYNDEQLILDAKFQKDRTDLETKYKIDAENRAAITEQQKLDLAKQRDLDEINRIIGNEAEKANLIIALNAKYIALQLELDTQKQQDDLKKKEDANLLIANNQANDFAVRLAAVQAREDAEKNIIFKTQDEKTAYEAANADARKKIAEQETNAKIALAQAAADSLGMLSEIAGKETAAGKALAIAQALINTYLGISQGVKLGFPAAIPAVLAASVTGFKAVKNIMAVQVPNSGGGGAGASVGGGSVSQAPVSAAPQFNVVGTSGSLANQVQSVTKVQEPIKAYVVSKDVTSAQSLDRNIIKAATIA